jgi:hypothetical protein
LQSSSLSHDGAQAMGRHVGSTRFRSSHPLDLDLGIFADLDRASCACQLLFCLTDSKLTLSLSLALWVDVKDSGR